MSSNEKAGTEAQPVTEFKIPQQCAHIRHRISLLQYKYWVLMLRAYREQYEAGKRFESGELCYLSMKDLSRSLGYKPRSSVLAKDIERIRKEELHFNVLEKDGCKAGRGWCFVSEWHVSSNRLGVVFPPGVRRAVEDLDKGDSIYHMLDWNAFNSFSRKFDAVIYKLCKDYVGAGRSPSFSLEQYRDYLGIHPCGYNDPSEFKRRCVVDPMKRINESEFSDIRIEAKFEIMNGHLVSIRFNVMPKVREEPIDSPAFRFAKVEIPSGTQRKFLSKRSPESIERSILMANMYLDEMSQIGKDVDCLAAYANAIIDDWGIDYEARLAKKAKKEAKASENLNPASMANKKASDASERKLLDDVKKFGWSCIGIAPEGTSGPFSFTVGFEQTYGHPELAIFGLPGEVAHGIFANAAHLIKTGRKFEPGTTTDELLQSFECSMVEVPKAAYREHFGFANWFYEGEGYRMTQIAWPDKNGLFPWQPGVHPQVNALQPVLGKNPYWTDFNARQKEEFDEIQQEIMKSIGPKIASGEYETVGEGDGGSRTLRFRISVFGEVVSVTATVFDGEDGLVRIEEVGPAEGTIH